MIVYLPLFIAIVGAFVWLAAKPKVDELGLVMFLCGLLAFLLTYGPSIVSVLHRR